MTPIASAADERLDKLRRALESSFAASRTGATAEMRLIALMPNEGEANRFTAIVYDYAAETGIELALDGDGRELGRVPLPGQPDLAPGELADAMAIVRARSAWSSGLVSGTHDLYEPMPAITADGQGRRLINVGVISEPKGRVVRPEGSGLSPLGEPDAYENEVVSVHLPSREIVRHAQGAPPTSIAEIFACGPSSSGCGASTGSCAANYHLEWPLPNPKWRMDIMHPSCTSSVQPDGTGIEIMNVYYDGKLILQRAGLPVLNVLYDGNTCGPYRDWLDSEDCFQATGTDVGTGFRVTTGNPAPQTLCESSSDAGNFKGVAIHDLGDELLLMTETNAGWYRYVMEWRFRIDGTIVPFFGFGATSNSCTCNAHVHHAYWRFEFAPDGDGTTGAGGVATLERIVPGTTNQWTPITQEGKFVRPLDWDEDWLRVRNPQTLTTYVIKPGHDDGTADPEADGTPDSYAKADFWALAYNAAQINDPNGTTSIGIDPWITGEAIGGTKRLVLWYRAGWRHGSNETVACETAGPTIEYSQPCAGSVHLARETYSCQDTVQLTLDDNDLVGAGSQAVTVQSDTEAVPETVLLSEAPIGSGHFTGAIATTGDSVSAGDGRISLSHGDSITVRYVDASYCGTPGVPVEMQAGADCAGPEISGVSVADVTETSATVSWTTNESANSRVTYGSAPPPSSVVEDLATYGTAHALALAGLAPCTTYYAAVGSADGVGNLTTADAGGQYFTATTRTRIFVSGPDDVEAGAGAWTVAGTAGSVWHVDTCKAASPTHAWKAGSATCPGTYAASQDTYLQSAVLSLGPAGHGYHLRFREWYRTQSGSDLLRPQVSVDGGSNWATLASYSGISGAWIGRDFDLSSYAGSNVRIRFWFHSDGSTQDEGWYIDDIDVGRLSSCTAEILRGAASLADDCAAGGTGDGNGIPEPGEEIEIEIGATNVGIAAATNLVGRLSSNTPGITIISSEAFYPAIPPGGSAAGGSPPLSFVVGTEVLCATTADLTVSFTADQGSWSSPLAVMIGAGGSSTATLFATGMPRSIPDESTIDTTLVVPPSGMLTDVNVGLSITHPYDADLDISLIHPSGSPVIDLSSDNGSAGDNYTGTIFDDEATTPITAGSPPFSGSFVPEAPLSALDGRLAGGTWTLRIADDAAFDIGSLTSWSLAVTAVTPPVCESCSISPPGEAGGLRWAAGGTTTLEWDPAPGASWYTLHRGTAGSVANLASSAVDSCRAAFVPEPSAGAEQVESPAAGSYLWFLVTPSNAAGEGPAGSGSLGPRILDSSGICP